jgi:hypothetical protein
MRAGVSRGVREFCCVRNFIFSAAEARQKPRGACIPRIGNDKGVGARMECAESSSLFSLDHLRSLCECRRQVERSSEGLDEVSFFAEYKPFGLGHGEIVARFRVRSQARAVGFV